MTIEICEHSHSHHFSNHVTATVAAKMDQRQFVPLTRLRVVRRSGRVAAVAGPVRVEELAARRIEPLVGVRAEVVALGLEQIGGKHP